MVDRLPTPGEAIFQGITSGFQFGAQRRREAAEQKRLGDLFGFQKEQFDFQKQQAEADAQIVEQKAKSDRTKTFLEFLKIARDTEDPAEKAFVLGQARKMINPDGKDDDLKDFVKLLQKSNSRTVDNMIGALQKLGGDPKMLRDLFEGAKSRDEKRKLFIDLRNSLVRQEQGRQRIQQGAIGKTKPFPPAVERQRVREAEARGGIVRGFERDKSGNLVPTPGGPAARKTPEQAAKAQLIESGISAMNEAVGAIFEGGDIKKGKIDRSIILNMSLETPFTEGRRVAQLVLDAVEAKLRAESGAAVPDTEVRRIARRFFPSPGDSNKSIRTKVRRLIDFLKGTKSKIEGTSQRERIDKTKTSGQREKAVRKKFGLGAR